MFSCESCLFASLQGLKSIRNYFINVTIFFALQQEGSLCAQHCLNALLQGTVPANADREQCVKC